MVLVVILVAALIGVLFFWWGGRGGDDVELEVEIREPQGMVAPAGAAALAMDRELPALLTTRAS